MTMRGAPGHPAPAPLAGGAAPDPRAALRHLPGHLSRAVQAALAKDIAGVLRRAPPFRPGMPGTGVPFSVLMSNCGPLGWVADASGYRYQPTHPETGEAWPPIPGLLLDLWEEVAGCPRPPEACLVNLYAPAARMGLHQDRDEADLEAPVLSVSLGAPATFRVGGITRRSPTRSLRLGAGDVLLLDGASRLAFHGIDRVLPGERGVLDGHPEFDGAARVNLTLRRVTLG